MYIYIRVCADNTNDLKFEFRFREATEARYDENPGDPDGDSNRVPGSSPRYPQPQDDTPSEDGLARGANERSVQR